MNEGRIIFKVTKAGVAVNSKWKVLLDGKCVGNIDFQNGLQIKTTKGQHTVRYKVGLQSTQVLWVDVSDDDVVVECEWDGTVRNFRVISGGQKNNTDNQEDISTNEAVPIKINEGKKKNNTGWIIGIVIAFLVMAYIAGSEEGGGEKFTYLDGIIADNNSPTGAVFDCSFSEVKAIIGKTLQVGDLNSSTGGWQIVSQASGLTEYSIGSSSGLWGINICVATGDKVNMVVCRTTGADMNSQGVTDYEIECFAKVFSKICGVTAESATNILKDLYESGSKNVYFESGVLFAYEDMNGIDTFTLMPMTKENYDDRGFN